MINTVPAGGKINFGDRFIGFLVQQQSKVSIRYPLGKPPSSHGSDTCGT